jgi:translocation and assembly module TamB
VLAGTAQAPQVEFSAEGDRLRSTITVSTGTPAWELGVFSANGRYSGTAGEARITARTVRAGDLRIVEAAIDAKGSLTEHTLAINARADAGSPFETIVASLTGGWEATANRWRGTIERAQTEGKVATSLTAPARLEVSTERVRLDEAELEFAGGRVAIASFERSASNGALASAGTFKDLAAATLAEWAGRLPGETRIGLVLGGAWQLRLDDAVSGTLRVSRQSGDLSILGARDAADVRRAERRAFGLEQFELLLTAERNRLDARLQAGGARIGKLEANVRTQLSQRQGAWGVAGTAPLEGRVSLAGASLALARVFAPDTVRLDGQLAGDINLAGTVGTPRLGGALELTRGRIDIPDEGLRLREGTALIKLEGDAARIESARFAGEQGSLSASGVLGWSGGAPAGELTFTLANLDAVTDPTYDLALTGTVNARIRGPAIALSGKVRADRGVIRLPESDTPVVSKDVVVRGRPPVAANRASVGGSSGGSGGGLPATDLVVDLGDKFAVKGRGVDAQITGTLALRGGERQPLRVNGVVRSDKGTVSAYGQTLAIERGTMTFTGPPDNPTLNVIAIRPNLTQRVGVQVTGFALEPRVALFADTAMPESEKLAWLVLGRSTEGLGPTDLAVLGTAASALLGGQTTQPLTNRLAALVGLDEIAVRRGEDSQATIVSVGKRLSDRLVLSVESGLQGLGAAVRLRYQVSSRWSVETRTGTSSTVNVFYSLSFD